MEELEEIKMNTTSLKLFEAANRNDLEEVKTIIEKENILPTIVFKDVYPPQTLPHIAIQKGYLGMLKYLLEKDSSLLNVTYYNSNLEGPCTLLGLAVERGDLEFVKYLVEDQNADIYQVFNSLYTAINWAVINGHLNITKYFIEERNVDVDKPPVKEGIKFPERFRPLLFDALPCKRDIRDYLIEERHADLTVIEDKSKENILFAALRTGDLNFIKHILDEKKAKIDINWKNKQGFTLVHKAVINLIESDKVEDVVRYLIGEKHADFEIPAGVNGSTPLHFLARDQRSHSIEITDYLIERGADVGKQDINGNTALHLAVPDTSKWGIGICKSLCKHGADVNQRNYKNETALDIALTILLKESKYNKEKKYTIEACKLFLEQGANVNTADKKGNQLVHIAAIRNLKSFLDYLLHDKQVDINTPRGTDSWTPLHCAARYNHIELCQYLVERGADIQAKGKCGKTPTQVASDQQLIDYLKNVSTSSRSCRSVEIYSPVLLKSPATYHEYTYESIAGPVDKNAISFPYGLRDFFFYINFLMRYFATSDNRSAQQHTFRSPASILLSRMDPVAENAVDEFL